jgi:hypothetical protein
LQKSAQHVWILGKSIIPNRFFFVNVEPFAGNAHEIRISLTPKGVHVYTQMSGLSGSFYRKSAEVSVAFANNSNDFQPENGSI